MKLCFLGDIRSFHVHKFVQWFAKDHETHLVSLDYPGDHRATTGLAKMTSIGTIVHLVKKDPIFLAPFSARKIIREINPDLVQCHFITNYGFMGAFSGVHPLVVTGMGDDLLIHPRESPLYNAMIKYTLYKADLVTCDGKNSLKALRTLGVRLEKRMLVYPGVDMEKFNPSKKVLLPYQTVFYPRGFDKIYDVDTLFEVIKFVHRNLPDVRFVLLGVGTELKRFKDMVREHKLTKWVEYLGNVPNDEIPAYMASSDVSITTSLSDGGIPASTVEAMACGVPVVSTDAGDADLWVIDGCFGYTVDKQNPTMMAYRIIDLLTSDDKRIAFGKGARKFVETRYDYSTEMKKIASEYEKLIAMIGRNH